MIILRNYFNIYTKIVLDDNGYKITDINNENSTVDGIGGVADNNKLYGLYVKNEKLFFLVETKSYELLQKYIYCSNKYITKRDRVFNLSSGNEKVCEIKYKPLVDPGIMYYDIEEDEFDVLLYISNLLKDSETTSKFVDSMKAK